MDDQKIIDGRYRIIDILGRGGMSTVYLAENIKLHTLWAIKQVSRESLCSADLLAEPNILKKLCHPSLPRIFDIIEDNRYFYLIVDYIDGVTLEEELKRKGRFPETEVLKWAKELCDVLRYLHSQKPNPIIYRDMKPSNVMLTRDGRIKLIDFGIAREYKASSENDTVYIGTRGYAAPEQYGEGQSNACTDIYSLGITLYQLLTGVKPTVPYYSTHLAEDSIAGISKELRKIIDKCIRVRPEERYQSVEVLLSDLENLKSTDTVCSGSNEKSDSLHGNRKGPEIVFFKRQMLAVIDNTEFACELAYCLSKLTQFKIFLADFNILAPTADIYMNLKGSRSGGSAHSGNTLIALKEAGMDITGDDLKRLCIKPKYTDNLYVFFEAYKAGNYDIYKEINIQKVLETAYGSFEVSIIVIPSNVFEIFAPEILKFCDYNILAASANTDILKRYDNYLQFMVEKHKLQIHKIRYVVYEYKPDVNIPPKMLRHIFTEDSYIGLVTYQKPREKYRNFGSYYLKWTLKFNREDYINILTQLGLIRHVNTLTKMKIIYMKTIIVLKELIAGTKRKKTDKGGRTTCSSRS